MNRPTTKPPEITDEDRQQYAGKTVIHPKLKRIHRIYTVLAGIIGIGAVLGVVNGEMSLTMGLVGAVVWQAILLAIYKAVALFFRRRYGITEFVEMDEELMREAKAEAIDEEQKEQERKKQRRWGLFATIVIIILFALIFLIDT